jgi:hypothetical protein
MTHPFRSWSTSLIVAAIRQPRYAGHGCAFSHANLADFGLLGFFGCLKELDQGANPSRRERPTFVHKGFVASEPGVCFCQFGLGCEAADDYQLPNVPTLSEFLPGFEASAFVAIGAPNNTPTEIIGRLNHEINAGLADPKIKARLAELGGTAFVGSPAGKLIAEEAEKWGKVIRAANIKAE